MTDLPLFLACLATSLLFVVFIRFGLARAVLFLAYAIGRLWGLLACFAVGCPKERLRPTEIELDGRKLFRCGRCGAKVWRK